jgi:hypothetical protein
LGPEALSDFAAVLCSGLGKEKYELLATEASGPVAVSKVASEVIGNGSEDPVAD